MKKNERLKAIVREWLEYKLGFPLNEKVANDIVDNIIGYENDINNIIYDQAGDNNVKIDEFVTSASGIIYEVGKPYPEFLSYKSIHHEAIQKIDENECNKEDRLNRIEVLSKVNGNQ
jgi:hypothetical protein